MTVAAMFQGSLPGMRTQEMNLPSSSSLWQFLHSIYVCIKLLAHGLSQQGFVVADEPAELAGCDQS
ncbi:hypothetical protein N7501_001482 [Penicillium viridicatum]|nr:hypothetical protein N7501_001482 [Penicillium viridicatum]